MTRQTRTATPASPSPPREPSVANSVASPDPPLGSTVTTRIHVTEARTADYVNGDSYIVPVGAMIDVAALEEEIATSRTYSPAALARDVEDAARAALAPHLAWNEVSVPTELALSLAAPALIDSRLTLSLAFASVDGPDVVFAASVADDAGRLVATARHGRRICNTRLVQKELAALRDAPAPTR